MKTQFFGKRWFGFSLILLSCGLLWLTRAGAATVVSGNISGTWTTNQSPYILSADCTVVSNQTLTIQPGVEVVIVPEVSLRVYGGITAIGRHDRKIRIRGATTNDYWVSIQMTHNGFTNRFEHCHISEGTDALWLSVSGGNHTMIAEIVNCDFANCLYSGVLGQAWGYPPTGPAGSLTGSATVAPEIHNCIFDTRGDGCHFTVGFISYNPSFPPGDAYANPHISGNVFKNLPPQGCGIALRLSASYTSAPSTNLSRPIFVNNTVIRNCIGVGVLSPNFSPVIRNNIFTNSNIAIYRIDSSPTPDVRYNCFYCNGIDFGGYPGAYGVPVIANHNGDPCDVFFNIFLDPRFLNTNRFPLSNSSPCIDAGDPAIADVCFQFSRGSAISDIGAYGGPDACGWLTNGFAPIVTGALTDQSSCVGANATFKVRVEGSEPLSYRWFFNGITPLAGETNAQLNLVNLQAGQAGLYSVTVSNAFGSATSGPARLVVSDACVGLHLYAGLSVTGIVGRTYTVESATNLAALTWTAEASHTFTQPQWLFLDTNTPFTAKKFFRVRLQP